MSVDNQRLKNAAVRWAREHRAEDLAELEAAAKEYAKAVYNETKPQYRGGGHDTIRFGRAKGTPLVEASTAELRWLVGAVERSIGDPEKERFLSDNQAYLGAINAELAQRGEE